MHQLPNLNVGLFSAIPPLGAMHDLRNLFVAGYNGTEFAGLNAPGNGVQHDLSVTAADDVIFVNINGVQMSMFLLPQIRPTMVIGYMIYPAGVEKTDASHSGRGATE